MSRATMVLIASFAPVSLLVLPMSASAQVSAGAPPRLAQPSSLSAAIQEMRRSPFYRGASAGVATGPGLLMSAISPVRLYQAPPADRTVSGMRVFLVTTGAAVVSDFVGLVMALCWGYGGGGGCLDSDGLSLLGAITIPVLGTVAGAKLAGARFVPALVGSALGLGLGVLALAAGPDPDDCFVLFFAIPVLAHAGVTTLFGTAIR